MKTPFAFNPELQRYVWLELTPHRLVIIPLVLTAVFYLNYLINSNFLGFVESLRITAMVAFCILVLIWGGKLVTESIISEVNEKTWDCQRMNASGPLSMTSSATCSDP